MIDDGEALSSVSESPHNRELDKSTKAERDIPLFAASVQRNPRPVPLPPRADLICVPSAPAAVQTDTYGST